jgi:hypothetical protein
VTQLLGSNHEQQLRTFVDNVGRVQRGETIVDEDIKKEREIPKAAAMPLVTLTKKPPPQKTEAIAKTKAAPSKNTVLSVSTTMKFVPETKLSAAKPNSNNKNDVSEQEKSSFKELDNGVQSTLLFNGEKVPAETPTIKTPPRKGTAAYNCGCFGSIHKALTNCLYCGRISCENEGYDYCPFCGYLVEDEKLNGAAAV